MHISLISLPMKPHKMSPERVLVLTFGLLVNDSKLIFLTRYKRPAGSRGSYFSSIRVHEMQNRVPYSRHADIGNPKSMHNMLRQALMAEISSAQLPALGSSISPTSIDQRSKSDEEREPRD
jgi:hypothetical protein